MTLLECALNTWSPGIGDPTYAGWLTTLAYGFTATLCLTRPRRGPDARFFAILGAILLALMINSQADLHVGLTAIGRCAARAQGWFQDRRTVQILFALAVMALAAAACAGALWRVRRRWRRLGLALAGTVALLGFAGLRAAAIFHLSETPALAHPALALEYAGLALIAINAIRA